MATNGMIKFKTNNGEKGLFTKFDADKFGEICEALSFLPTDALKKIMVYLKDENGGYVDMFDPRSWCEYGYVMDLDNTKYDTYSIYESKKVSNQNTGRLNYVDTCQFNRVETVEGETHSLIITWDDFYKGLYDLPLTEEQTIQLADILASTGEWFARNVFNSIEQEYQPLPKTMPDNWVILDTNKINERKKIHL